MRFLMCLLVVLCFSAMGFAAPVSSVKQKTLVLVPNPEVVNKELTPEPLTPKKKAHMTCKVCCATVKDCEKFAVNCKCPTVVPAPEKK